MPAAIRDASATYAKQPAFTLALPNGSQGSITFEETDRLSDQFAVYLREVAGFKAGDRVAIQMPNCLAYPIAVFGTLKAGLVMANTNPLYTTAEMVHQFTDSGAVGLIAIDLFATKVAEVLPKTSIKHGCGGRHFGFVAAAQAAPRQRGAEIRQEDGAADHVSAHDDARRALAQGADRIAAGADREGLCGRRSTHNSIAALQYTGGTTGVAKGAMLTHGNLVANTHPGPRDVEAVPALRRGSDADGAAAVPHLRVHREPDDLLSRRRTERARAEPAAALEPEDGDAERADHVVHRRQHAVRGLDARAVVQGEDRTGRCAARSPAAWRSCR